MTKKIQRAVEMHRQGDILFKKISDSAVPSEAKKNSKMVTNLVVAEGELTGHCHTLVGNSLLMEHGMDRYVKVDAPTKINHQEHDVIDLSAGTYQVIRQQEWNVNEWRLVSD